MLVEDYMSRHPFMPEEESSILDARGCMSEVRVRRLPVLKDNVVTGMIIQIDGQVVRDIRETV